MSTSTNKISDTVRGYYYNLPSNEEADKMLDEMLEENEESQTFADKVIKKVSEGTK